MPSDPNSVPMPTEAPAPTQPAPMAVAGGGAGDDAPHPRHYARDIIEGLARDAKWDDLFKFIDHMVWSAYAAGEARINKPLDLSMDWPEQRPKREEE